jgi:hypothetical protein
VDNEYLTVSFDNIALNGLDRYYVVFRSDSSQADGVVSPAIWLKETTSVEDILYQGGSMVEGLAIDAVYSYTTVPNMGHYIAAFLCIAVVAGLICMVRRSYIKSLLWQFVRAGWILFFGGLLWYNLRYADPINSTLFNQEQAWKFFKIFLGAGILIFTLLLLVWKGVGLHFQKRFQEKFQKQIQRFSKFPYPHIIFWVAAIVVLVLVALRQIYLASLLYQRIGWDVDYVWQYAKEIKETGTLTNVGYLSLYPNNKALTMFVYFLMKRMGNASDKTIYWAWVVINIVLIDTSFCMSFSLARKYFDNWTAVISTAVEIVLLGLSGWIIVPYSDTMTAWIPLAILCLYQMAKEKKKISSKVIALTLIGFLVVWGYYLKPQCVIVFIAILMCCLGTVRSIQKGQRIWFPVGIIAGIIVGAFTYQLASAGVFQKNIIEGVSMPPSHFVMMGMNENPTAVGIGSYDSDSTSYSSSAGNSTEEHDTACKERIRHYLEGYGLRGYLHHLFQKGIWILGDGSFFWQGEGGFYQEDYSYQEGNQKQQEIREIYYGSSGGYDAAKLQMSLAKKSGLWFCVIAFMTIFVLSYGRNSKFAEEKTILALAACGCLLFTMLFEGRSRYLINYLPFYCMLGAGGFVWLVRDGVLRVLAKLKFIFLTMSK